MHIGAKTMLPLDPDTADDAAAIVRDLLDADSVLAMERLSGGGNNRLYRVETRQSTLALKCYGTADRLTREFDALAVLAACGEESVPRPVAADRTRRAALYGWVDGAAVGRNAGERPDGDIAQALAFAARLTAPDLRMSASMLGEAAEACLSLSELGAQIKARFARLLAEAPELHGFLDTEARPAIDGAMMRARGLYADTGLDPERPLDPRLLTLSPSDFGFHNALRRSDGRLVFLDFEYFGWDDPVKLTADLLWHPGFALSPAERSGWLDGCVALFGTQSAGDPGFATRLEAQMPLYGLRWCLILLNEFLPERWERRCFAGTAIGWEEAKAFQLAKAQTWLAEVSRQLDTAESPFPASFAPAER